jgi:hypothetical protein
MCAKLKEEGLECPLFPMPCWHIDEETHPPTSLNIQKSPQLEKETCLLGTDCNKDHPLLKLQLSSHPHKKEQYVKPNQFEWG